MQLVGHNTRYGLSGWCTIVSDIAVPSGPIVAATYDIVIKLLKVL